MLYKVFGIHRLDFANDKGERIVGTNLYVGSKDARVEGLKTEKFFISEAFTLPPDLKPNDNIDITHNSTGKVVGVNAVAKTAV